jgi:hypothetical protein
MRHYETHLLKAGTRKAWCSEPAMYLVKVTENEENATCGRCARNLGQARARQDA